MGGKRQVLWGAPPRDKMGWLSYFQTLPSPDEVLMNAGLDVRAYFSTLRYAHTQAVAETRQLNALRREVIVRPRDDRSAECKKAAVLVNDEFERIGVRQLRSELWWGTWVGYSLAMLEWESAEIGYRIKRWAVVPQHLVTLSYNLPPKVAGDVVDENRYILCKTGGFSVFDLYGRGCAQGAFWPSMFLLADWKYWADDVERYAAPRIMAMVPPGYVASQEGQDYVKQVIDSLDNLVRGGTAALEADDKFKLQELQHVAGATSKVHADFQQAGNELISKAVLGQTLSTDGGTIGTGAESLGRVHAETGLLPRIDADLDMLDSALQRLADLICRWRYFRDDLSPVISHAGPRIQSTELSIIINDIGLKVSEADAYEILGVPVPEPNAPVVAGKPVGATPVGSSVVPTSRIGLRDAMLADAVDPLDSLERRWGTRLKEEYKLLGEAMLRTVKGTDWKPKSSPGRQRVLGTVLRDMLIDAQLTGLEQVLKSVPKTVKLADSGDLAAEANKIAVVNWQGPDDPRNLSVTKVEIDGFNAGFAVPLKNEAAERVLLYKTSFPYLEAKARQIEQYAFTIAGVEDMALVDYARSAVMTAAQGAMSLPEFRSSLEKAFFEAGASPISPAHAETVLRTNLASAYEGARYDAVMTPALAEVFPGFQLFTVGDSRVRPEHEVLNGTYFERDDPRLAEYWPPMDYNCRCTMLALSPEDIHAEGLDNAPAAELNWRPPESFREAPGSFDPAIIQERRRR